MLYVVLETYSLSDDRIIDSREMVITKDEYQDIEDNLSRFNTPMTRKELVVLNQDIA
ncbi:hypothetical protein HLH26_05745 [Gluconacetobacter sp. 1b LMG 1731]|uniref:Uncharacterized protein n=1 Tax=Gluconacetobacter dulcium TaxID=2729096 RepID=A0A7W4IJM4_9PROT|nr:hypothetical protein [Gluconacetobacter dulcium]MBB2164047.1 hypothetical protein [Gluconacetobacter dulcium]MBB2192751.1 hypothetical protein [Gluconacetobacter dulcium]